MTKKVFRLLSLSLVAILAMAFVAACNGDDDGNGNGNGNGSVTVETPGLEFDPDSLSMAAGETLEVTLDNTDNTLHSFTIDELGIDIEAAGGESETVTIDAPEAGEYEFYCHVPGHREAGQVGTLTVE